MRKTRSLYKDDVAFDLIQKTKRSSGVYKVNINYADEYTSQRDLNDSKISVADLYLTGLVKEIKETIVNFDDDIFSELQADNNKKSTKDLKIKNFEFKTKNTLKKNPTLASNRSKKSHRNKNQKSSRSKNRHYSSKSNKNGSVSYRSQKSHKSTKDNKNNNMNLMVLNNKKSSNLSNSKRNSSHSNKIKGNYSDNKSKMKRNLSATKDLIMKKEAEKKKKIENEQKENLTLVGFNHMNSLNSYSFSKKSSFKPKEIKRFSYYMNPTQKFLSPFRTSTATTLKKQKSVRFKVNNIKKTYTGMKQKRNNIQIRRWSETSNRRKSNRENNLFSFFQRPEFFEESFPRKTQSNDVLVYNQNDDNEQLFKLTQLSNKNILQLNEITQDLKKSFVLSSRNVNFKMSDLNKKSFLYDHEDSFEESIKSNEKDEEKEKENELSKRDKEKNYRELQRKGVVYDSLDEYNDDDISTFFIHPDSKYLLYLDGAVTFCVFYHLIYLPYFLGYNEMYCRTGNFITLNTILEFIIDIIYFIDFIIHFFIGYYNDDDILKTELSHIIIHNLKTWFIVDLMGIIPFKTLFYILDTKCKDIHFISSYQYNKEYYYLFICFRLVKIIRLNGNKFLEYLEERLDKYEHYNNYLYFYLGSLIFCITIHVVTCILIFLGKNDYPSWIVKFGFEEYNFGQLYFLGISYIRKNIWNNC